MDQPSLDTYYLPSERYDRKIIRRWLVLKVVLAFVSLVLIYGSVSSLTQIVIKHRQAKSTAQHQKVMQNILGISLQNDRKELPVRLKIPQINVDANIEYVGFTSKGEMAVPYNTIDVGLFGHGALPGEQGSAVIAGHADGENGEDGVFTNLHKLAPGDQVIIEDNTGSSTAFLVRESRTYDPGFANEVFNRNDSAYLNLITCDGTWNEASGSYTKRLVVFADIMK